MAYFVEASHFRSTAAVPKVETFNLAWVKQKYISHNISARIPDDKWSFGSPGCRWQDNIAIDLHYEDINLTYLTHDRNIRRVDLRMAINFRIQYKANNFLTTWLVVDFPRMALFFKLDGVCSSIFLCVREILQVGNCISYLLAPHWPTDL